LKSAPGEIAAGTKSPAAICRTRLVYVGGSNFRQLTYLDYPEYSRLKKFWRARTDYSRCALTPYMDAPSLPSISLGFGSQE